MSTEYASPASEAERDRLILDHLALLQHIVGRMSLDVPGRIQRDDLFERAYLIAVAIGPGIVEAQVVKQHAQLK